MTRLLKNNSIKKKILLKLVIINKNKFQQMINHNKITKLNTYQNSLYFDFNLITNKILFISILIFKNSKYIILLLLLKIKI